MKNIVIKVLVGLLPVLVLWWNYIWMFQAKYLGWAFLILWIVTVLMVWKLSKVRAILHRLFRATEIAFFLLPISAIVFTLSMGAQAVKSTTDAAEQVGAIIGTGLGGAMIVTIAFIAGLMGGFIMHLIANRYSVVSVKQVS